MLASPHVTHLRFHVAHDQNTSAGAAPDQGLDG
jgi:hypothetical protein